MNYFGGRSESNYGSPGLNWRSMPTHDEEPDYKRRESIPTPIGRDEGYSSLSSYASSGFVVSYFSESLRSMCN